jgi:hypothetical protein
MVLSAARTGGKEGEAKVAALVLRVFRVVLKDEYKDVWEGPSVS